MSTTYVRVSTDEFVEVMGAVAMSVTVVLSAGRTLASARLGHGPKAVGLSTNPGCARTHMGCLRQDGFPSVLEITVRRRRRAPW